MDLNVVPKKMTESEVEELTSSRHRKSTVHDPRFTEQDTAELIAYFGNAFPPEFLVMRKLLPNYNITGDHFPAGEVIATYEWESKNNPNFTEDFIPFYGIGNGDFLCLSKAAGEKSPVLYVAHDDPEITKLHEDFSGYLNDPEWYSEQ